ncbi:MAG TPA: YggS family pyridoxal phosphate-dependent enzyme [Syntrophales bacterium]|nr:YggS family pyridoxal phosphate-dependent enzyme [Syntrophales bacterium]
MNSTVKSNIERIRGAIAAAALRVRRRVSDVRVMAVTKTVDDDRIMEAIEAGVDIIGESYVQEAKRKIEKMGRRIEWHMIGHLQSNKAKYAVKLFNMIHSVDRIDLAVELNRRAGAQGMAMKILIEINTGGEKTKSGIPYEKAMQLVRDISSLDNLSIQGLMTMAPWFDNPEDARPYFKALRELRDRIIDAGIPRVEMRELSMGMSGDYEIAVEEGATIVRVGRSIFGDRPAKPLKGDEPLNI